MSHSLFSRALIASWALWFTAALTEVPGVHTCAVHGAHGAHRAHAATMSHAGHATHMAHDAMASGSTNPSHHEAVCSCLGLCCCAAPVSAPSASIELVLDDMVAAPAHCLRHVVTPDVGSAHSLPFANGPPAL